MKKRLTINHIASAALRSDKRAYLSLAAGIFLAIFLVSTLAMCAWGMYLMQEEDTARRVGRQDFLLLDCDVTDERLMSEGHFDQLGHVYITASIEDTRLTIGWYDATAAELINRKCVEGRFPALPGEIALERSVLEGMRSEARVGSTMDFALTPIEGAQETRTFTIVGILDERETEWSLNYSNEDVHFPSALVSPDEAEFATGRVAVGRVMTVKSGRVSEVLKHWTVLANNSFGNLFHSMVGFDYLGYPDNYWENMADSEMYQWLIIFTPTSLMIFFIGISLIIASGVGISQAMEGRLTQRTEQIGMLRAVGATRKQIRRIFGRETWLIALILSPLSAAAGCGAAYVLSRLLPDKVMFGGDWRLIVPIVIGSALIILLSANLPLRRASRIAPMGVLRDVQLLRRAKKIRGKKNFRPESLLVSRQLRLYPSRQIGSAVLVAMMLSCVMLSVALTAIRTRDAYSDKEQFRMYSTSTPGLHNDWDYGLTDSDLAQLEALDGVEYISPRRDFQGSTYLIMEEPGEYVKPTIATVNIHLYDEVPEAVLEYLAIWDSADPMNHIRARTEEYQEARQALGVTEEMVEARFSSTVITEEMAEALAPYVVEGRIDLDALNAGREVLVLAPTVYTWTRVDSDGRRYWTTSHAPQDGWGEPVFVRENDTYRAGQTLKVMQFYEPSLSNYGMGAHMAEAEYQTFTVKVGAVLTQSRFEVSNILSAWLSGNSIVVTERGAKALGMYPGWLQEIGVYLTSSDIDLETERALLSRIEAIGMRAGDGYFVDNNIAIVRQDEEGQRQLVAAFAAMAIVFFAVSVGMVAGNMRRRVRADKRMIGTLRAVGADAGVLMRSYTGQMSVGIGAGTVMGLAIMWFFVPIIGNSVASYAGAMVQSALAIVGFAAACWLACCASLNRSLKEVMKRSIVENIREL